ncbi:MAG: AI-2E family transporter [Polyangiaceae bacterium]|nr:AI-2E family transporter [Polyangiaceae bacterium]
MTQPTRPEAESSVPPEAPTEGYPDAPLEASPSAPRDAANVATSSVLAPEATFATQQRLQRMVLGILALGISALFLWMIHEFLIALLFAAILSSMALPLHAWLTPRLWGKKTLASAATLSVLLLVLIVPLTAFLAVVATQAVDLGERAQPWITEQVRHAPDVGSSLKDTALYRTLEPHREEILQKLGEAGQAVGRALVGLLTQAIADTVSFLFMLFVMLYATFFFLIDGRSVLRKILYYLPLASDDETRMIDRFVSVTRATIKGTLVIGILQGALGGLAFWVAGIEGAALWGTAMAILSVIPGIGPLLVWLPAVVYLVAAGHFTASLGLFLWCSLVVGSVDNLLRPWLVGKDTQMPDLLIFLSTLGGIVLFGAAGIVIGPILGALFITVWDLYGVAFKGVLPPSHASTRDGALRGERPSLPPS